MDPKWYSRTFIILGIIILLNIFSWSAVIYLNRPALLEVNFLDVGQGDSIFINTPAGHQILIDGGPDQTVSGKLSKILPFWDRTIDLVILTHPDKDHVAGLIDVLKRYDVKNILWTGVIRDTLEYKAWINALDKEGARIFIAKAGQSIKSVSKNVAADRPVSIEILYPSGDLAGLELEDSNETSIVARLRFNESSILFTGDIANIAEQKLISSEAELTADILKVAHHGSKFSTSEQFIEKVLPNLAVIQVGKNSYGHPTSEVLERLDKFGIDVLRTDEAGSIKIISNGKNYDVSSF